MGAEFSNRDPSHSNSCIYFAVLWWWSISIPQTGINYLASVILGLLSFALVTAIVEFERMMLANTQIYIEGPWPKQIQVHGRTKAMLSCQDSEVCFVCTGIATIAAQTKSKQRIRFQIGPNLLILQVVKFTMSTRVLESLNGLRLQIRTKHR